MVPVCEPTSEGQHAVCPRACQGETRRVYNAWWEFETKTGGTIGVEGQQREVGIFIDGKVIMKLLIKGLLNRIMAFDAFVDWMAKEADSAWHRFLRRTPSYARGTRPKPSNNFLAHPSAVTV